ncbi:hypothetical protein NL108_017824 [Boleophthalmus pectinirostris]|nr:hypothetical protein NL108_017824 [Boleophthalmus pectinirostris]
MGPVWVWCCFLLSLGTLTVGKVQVESWGGLVSVPKGVHLSKVKNVVKLHLVAKVDPEVKVVQLESGVVEVLPESVPHPVFNDSAHAVDVGNPKNLTDPVTHDDGQNNTLNDNGSHYPDVLPHANVTVNDEPVRNHTCCEHAMCKKHRRAVSRRDRRSGWKIH